MSYRRQRLRRDNLEFSLKDKLLNVVSDLTESTQAALKAKANQVISPINPTDPALLPYNANIKNAVNVAQGTGKDLQQSTTQLSGMFTNKTLLLIGVGVLIVVLYLYFKK